MQMSQHRKLYIFLTHSWIFFVCDEKYSDEHESKHFSVKAEKHFLGFFCVYSTLGSMQGPAWNKRRNSPIFASILMRLLQNPDDNFHLLANSKLVFGNIPEKPNSTI
jgi:hypothetical protein